MTEPQRLRILMVGLFPDDPERVQGGVEAATLSVSQALADHPDVEKVVVASVRVGAPAGIRQLSDKLEVHSIPAPFVSGDTVIRSEQAVRLIRPLVRSFKPHVVHGQGIDRQGEIATRLGLPAVITVHGLIHVEARLAAKSLASRLRAGMFEAMIRRVLNRAKVVISISDYDATALEGLIAGQRVSIPNAVPDVFFEKTVAEPTPGTVLFAGVLRPRKNVLGLLNAFAKVREQLPTASLELAGPAPDTAHHAAVEAHIAELGLGDAITMLGHVSNDDLVAAMRRCTTLALFSLEETLPTTIAQAMAVGRPVVASDVGGIPEMLGRDGEAGFLVPSKDEDALAKRLLAVLSNPEGARSMGEIGHTRAEARYAARAVADRTVEAYRTAVAAGAKA